jgi:hypothetical protein
VRSMRRVIALCAFLVTVAMAQNQRQTEAQSDGFHGQVKAVVTYVDTYGDEWQQPEGPALVYPVGFRDLEYDIDGNRIKLGEILPDGRFFGETVELVRSTDGQIVQRIATDADSGKVSRHDWLGPFGATKTDSFFEGKLLNRQLFTYDPLGHLSHRMILDGDGKHMEELAIKNADDGSMIEKGSWGNDGGSTWYEYFNAQTDSLSFGTFDDSGHIQLNLSSKHGKVVSFWSASDEPDQFGRTFTDQKDHGNFDRYSCRKGGACDVAHVHYEYADAARENPTSVEWRGSNGELLYAAYYEYEVDSRHNWVHRKVWVRSPNLPNRTPYETDSRSITYWGR